MKRKILITVVAAGALLLGGLVIFVLAFDLMGQTHEETLKVAVSPDGRFSARLYTLDGGATTGTYYRVDLAHESGEPTRVFLGEFLENADIEWTEDRKFLISSQSVVKREDIFVQVLKIDSVEIGYSSGLMP